MFFVADGKFHFIPLRKNKIQATPPQYNVQNKIWKKPLYAVVEALSTDLLLFKEDFF